MVGVPGGGDAVGGAELVGPEHVLDPFGERLAVRPVRVLAGQAVELVQIIDDVREVRDRPVVEVVAGVGVGELGRGVPDERDDLRWPARVHLLVHEAHGHGGVWVDPRCELKAILVGHLARQARLHELDARGLEAEQPVEVG